MYHNYVANDKQSLITILTEVNCTHCTMKFSFVWSGETIELYLMLKTLEAVNSAQRIDTRLSFHNI